MLSITDYGAVAGGEVLCTAAIQAAIDACHRAGGGRVLVPAGTYRTGTVYLRDRVELHLAHGATLLASENMDDYNAEDAYAQNASSASEGWCGKHLILAVECEDVAITGEGCIDGSADAFFEPVPRFYPDCAWLTGYGWRDGFTRNKDKSVPRPGQMVAFVECRHVRVQNVTLQNAPCWTCHFHGCDFVQVRGVRIHSKPYRGHVDGIDIDCCRFVTVSDCIVEAGDDAITFRCNGAKLRHHDSVCEHVTVTNCVLRASACAFRAGVGTGTVRHVRVSNITVTRAGCLFDAITGYLGHGRAEIYDIHFTNITAPDLGFLFEIDANNAPVRGLSLSNARLCSIAGAKIHASGEGEAQDISLRHLAWEILPEKEALTDHRRARRGEDMLSLFRVRGAFLEDISLKCPETVRATWRDVLHAEECEGLVGRVRENFCKSFP